MKKTDILVGRWYETTLGVGQCVATAPARPPRVTIRIDRPIPRGRVNLAPREVIRELGR